MIGTGAFIGSLIGVSLLSLAAGAWIMWKICFREGGVIVTTLNRHELHRAQGMQHAYAHVMDMISDGHDTNAIGTWVLSESERLDASTKAMAASDAQAYVEQRLL